MAYTRYGFLDGFGRLPVAVFLAGMMMFVAVPVHAQKKPAANPVGAGWDSKVKAADSAAGQTFTDEQTAAIKAVNDYFNALQNLKGRFEQLDPDKKKTKGKFFVHKPGKFRFDYARPSRKVVVSDGRFLAIQDLDLRSE
ncbi:MAG: outer membrane lipoprotein carrier protein LolA, partial [Pseudomonadota bacterium]